MTINRAAYLAFLAALVVATHAILLSGCAADSPVATGTPSSATGTTSQSRPPSTYTVSTLPESGEYWQQLKETSEAAARLGGELQQKGTADPDLTAQIYALRARGQAITAARALVDRDTELADEAAEQLRRLLIQAQNANGPRWAAVIEEAAVHVGTLILPSTDPAAAREQLDTISELLAPLMPPTTTSTS